jgi:hypothetical protein
MHRAGSNLYLGFAAALLAAAVAGCSGFGAKKETTIDPNAFPTNYRTQISQFLAQSLTNRADFRNAQISAPVLKPVGDSQRYTVCVRLNGNGMVKDKVAIYYGGMMAQFVDSTPELCGDAVYTPFRELSGSLPPA